MPKLINLKMTQQFILTVQTLLLNLKLKLKLRFHQNIKQVMLAWNHDPAKEAFANLD